MSCHTASPGWRRIVVELHLHLSTGRSRKTGAGTNSPTEDRLPANTQTSFHSLQGQDKALRYESTTLNWPMRLPAILCVLALMFLTACTPEAPTTAETPREPQADTTMPGSDRDEHGCIPSAGYSWCPRTNQCERPWELAEAGGFENTAEAFDAYCEVSEEE